MTGSPSRLSDPIERARLGGDALLVALLHFEQDLDLGAAQRHLGDLADLDAGDADDGAALQPLDVGNLVLSS